MTEYDFSPEAYEKYVATQVRIARWVDDTQRTELVGPDVPPTPLEVDGTIPLPRKRDRKSRSTRPSPAPSPPEKSKKYPGKKRSKSASATQRRVPTPFIPTPELPEPGCPVYRGLWVNEAPKAPTPPPPTPPPEPSSRPSSRKGRRPSTPTPRNPSWPPDSVPTRELPEPGCPVYFSGPDSDETPAVESTKPPHPAARKRSMSFSAVASRPFQYSAAAAPLYHSHNNSPHHSSTRDHPSYYSSHNSSPVYPYTPAAPYAAQQAPPVAAPVYPVKSFSYPLPFQQYPNYDAVGRREPSRTHNAPAHAPHYSTDSSPYAYTTPGYLRQRSQPVEKIYQHLQQPPPRPSSVPQPGTVPHTFPNGKTLHIPLSADLHNVRFFFDSFPISFYSS
ncbi:hypothetical protein AN958_02441 [Leucoagaricus sp. SymC.cos]|nr:hypothetical protein AN958_02441 [Leucoagaricus sp. SymC.cos]